MNAVGLESALRSHHVGPQALVMIRVLMLILELLLLVLLLLLVVVINLLLLQVIYAVVTLTSRYVVHLRLMHLLLLMLARITVVNIGRQAAF